MHEIQVWINTFNTQPNPQTDNSNSKLHFKLCSIFFLTHLSKSSQQQCPQASVTCYTPKCSCVVDVVDVVECTDDVVEVVERPLLAVTSV